MAEWTASVFASHMDSGLSTKEAIACLLTVASSLGFNAGIPVQELKSVLDKQYAAFVNQPDLAEI